MKFSPPPLITDEKMDQTTDSNHMHMAYVYKLISSRAWQKQLIFIVFTHECILCENIEPEYAHEH